MLQLTESARDAVRGIVAAEQAAPDSGLRIASEAGADGGPALSMAIAESPSEGDAVLDQGDVRLFLVATAAAFLAAPVLDAEAPGDHVPVSSDEPPPPRPVRGRGGAARRAPGGPRGRRTRSGSTRSR